MKLHFYICHGADEGHRYEFRASQALVGPLLTSPGTPGCLDSCPPEVFLPGVRLWGWSWDWVVRVASPGPCCDVGP